MHTLHQHVGCHKNLFFTIKSKHSTVIAYASERRFIFKLYIFSKTLDEPKLTKRVNFCPRHLIYIVLSVNIKYV